MKNCPKCGLVCGERQSFCERCGTPLFATRTASGNHTPPNDGGSYAPYGWAEDTPYAPRQSRDSRQTQSNIPPYQTPSNSKPHSYPPVSYQPPVTMPSVPYAPYQSQISFDYRCPRCAVNTPPRLQKKVSLAGWIVFGVLLFTFPPLCWVGFFIKEDRPVCQHCGYDPK